MSNKTPSIPCQNGVLPVEEVSRWREHGFCLVHDLLPETLLQDLLSDAMDTFPAPGSEAAANTRDFGSGQRFVFPSRSTVANAVTLHANLLQAVATLLGVGVMQLRLTQSDVWPKYGRAETSVNKYDNAEQRIHCDYPNHMLVHPPPWEQPAAVEIIIYLNNHDECGGATAVVPREGPDDPAYSWPIVKTPGVAGLQYVNDRDRAEAYLHEARPEAAQFRADHLYPREVVADYRFGSVLFYRHDTWHRGTPLKRDALRIVQNLTFRRDDADWINILHPGWSWSMYHPDQHLERLVAQASVEQRTVMGFPAPGSSYWSDATVDAVEARYAAWGIDMSPYRLRLA